MSPRGFNGGARVASRGFSYHAVGPRVFVGAPFRSFARPYYAFRSHFSLGFGLFIGYPVAFPYYGYYGYSSAYPYAGVPYPYPYYAYPDPVVTYPGVSSAAPYPSTVQPYPAPAPAPAAPADGALNPDQENFGGASFAITPTDAQVYVDGEYVGFASAFSATSQPLTLTPGRHHVEIRAPGYQTMSSDVDIQAGEVIPFQGTMQR